MKCTTLASLIVALACAQSCSSAPASPEPRGYTLVFLKTGPRDGQLPDADRREAFAGHFSNMERLAQEHKLVVAGPFGQTRHDPALRGLFVMNSAQRDEAVAWASTDPTTQAGVFTLEYHDLKSDAPLEASLQRHMELAEQAKAEGKPMKPGDGARPYVLLVAEHGDLARRELAPLLKGGGVFLLAQIDDARALALLDASNVGEAKERFGPALEQIGAHTLDDWFATAQLEQLEQLRQR